MIKVAGFEKESFVDGNGIRYTIFVQGCKHHCKGCHNPSTWNFQGGIDMTTQDILEDIKSKKDNIDGITLSGGDPIYQAKNLIGLVKAIKEKTELDIWCYTGFTFEELKQNKDKSIAELLKYVDVIVDGQYIQELSSTELRFKGSSNQRIIDVKQSIESNKVVLWEEEEDI